MPRTQSKKSIRKKRRSKPSQHYLKHKESARAFIHERITYWNQFYGFAYNRVAIKNQKRCWGSCSEKGNLNFSYKVLFLPPHLADYIIVHELCHLGELNHSSAFWDLVAQTLPEYKKHKKELQHIGNGSYTS